LINREEIAKGETGVETKQIQRIVFSGFSLMKTPIFRLFRKMHVSMKF